MDFDTILERIQAGQDPKWPSNADTVDFAKALDAQDPLGHLRDEFVFPTTASLTAKALKGGQTAEGKLSPLLLSPCRTEG